MSVIDIHAHAFPDKVAGRAMTKLEGQAPIEAVGDGTVAGLLASMDEAGVDITAVCAIATKPDQAKGIFKWCKAIRSDRIEPMPSVHPDTPKAARWLERFAKDRFAGIKLHPMYQQFAADERRLDDIYAACADLGLVVQMHCGRDIAYPPEDDRASPSRLQHVLERFDGLRLVCTHMGGWQSWDQVAQHLLGRDVHLETSFSLAALGPERSVEMIRAHGVEKVMFGSDWPWKRQREEIGLIRGLGLGQPQMHALLWSNAAKLLGY